LGFAMLPRNWLANLDRDQVQMILRIETAGVNQAKY